MKINKNLKFMLKVTFCFVIILLIKYNYSFGEREGVHPAQNQLPVVKASPAPLHMIRNIITESNDRELILNEEVFGPLETNSIIIVVQVHKRLSYLKHLINSLSSAWNISQALLIFSHDFYDDEINEQIRNIKFCKVMQIFLPYSIQLHPNEFPGTDPNDCGRDVNKSYANTIKCNNYASPDAYGHYREAHITQIKHHWWWKANKVFDKLQTTKHHNGLFLFLEEDHYVVPDFLPVMHTLQKEASSSCLKCNIFTLGNYKAKINNELFNDQRAFTDEWVSSQHNMGMAFDRKLWTQIKKCSKTFCTYDDYNWDWTFQHTGLTCLKNKLHVMGLKAPRVFHMDPCGTHPEKNAICDPSQKISKLKQAINYAIKHDFLAPKKLIVKPGNLFFSMGRNNGGWGDKRDHSLCLNMTIQA